MKKTKFRFINRWPKDEQCGYGRDSKGILKFVFVIEADKTINQEYKVGNKMFKFIRWLLPEVENRPNVSGKDQTVGERKEERRRQGRKYGTIILSGSEFYLV